MQVILPVPFGPARRTRVGTSFTQTVQQSCSASSQFDTKTLASLNHGVREKQCLLS